MKYGVIKIGGKQIKAIVGESIWVEKLDVEVGSEYVFESISAISDGKKLFVGNPDVKDAKIKAVVEKQGKGPKLIIFRTKQKSNWSRKQGHRQPYTRLKINEINLNGKSI